MNFKASFYLCNTLKRSYRSSICRLIYLLNVILMRTLQGNAAAIIVTVSVELEA